MPDTRHTFVLVLLVVLEATTVQTQPVSGCGGQLNQQSGVITSPGYPDSYPNYMNCLWTITAAAKEIITIRFNRLDLEGSVSGSQFISDTCPDYVKIYDGDSVNSPLIATMCRMKTQSELATMIIRSTKNRLLLVFVSDYQGQRPGFVASYWSQECPEFTYGSESCNKTCDCDRENTAYCNNTNGACICKAGWTSHDCSKDVNECLNPTVEPCPFNYMECVNTVGGYECVCKDGLTENANGECEVEPHAACNGDNSCSHVCVSISTEGQAPQQHCYCPDNMKLVGDSCEACSNVNFGKDCRLNCPCVSNNTESCDTTTGGCNCLKGWTLSNCSKDINECTELPQSVCKSDEYCVNTLGGYQCNCKTGTQKPPGGSCGDCSYALSNSSGVIRSPNYPQYVTSDVNCSWTITTTNPGATILLSLTDVYMSNWDTYRVSCYYGALEVYDGINSSAELLGRYCSYDSTPNSIRSTAGAMYLALRTSRFYSQRFNGTYSTENYQVFRSNVTAPSNNITSPGYPVSSTHNTYVTWTITVASGNVVTFSFSDSDLGECGKDFVEFYDGSHAGAKLISRFCGNNFPRNISSTERWMHIIYSSEGSTNEKGLNGSYITDACKCSKSYTASCNSPSGPCVCKSGYTGISCDNNVNECMENPCPDHSTCIDTYGSYYCDCWNGTRVDATGTCEDWNKTLYDQSGTIQSQGYPNSYPFNLNYTWIIIGKPNTVVSFRFLNFDVQTFGKCNTDMVAVYDVNYNNQLIGQYCGTNIPGLLRTNDNVMQLTFKTDGYDYYRTYTGFKGTYYSHVCPLFYYGEETCSTPCSCAYDTTRVCDNTNGVCICQLGWVGRGCSEDLDECRNPGACPDNSDCFNVPGSYSCECHSGYVLDNTTGLCIESSHCSDAMKEKCSHLCDVDKTTNEEKCYCPKDLILLSDNITCVVSFYPYGVEAGDYMAYGKTNTPVVTSFVFNSLVPIGSTVQNVASVHYQGVIVFNGKKVTAIPDFKTAKAAKQKLIAPFWTEQKTSGVGEVFYHVYEKCRASNFYGPDYESKPSPKEEEVFSRAIRDVTKIYNLPAFEPTLVLVATWIAVQPKGCGDNLTNTYQAIFVSGRETATEQTYLQVAEKSYGIFIYKDCDGICEPGQPFEVGIVTDTGISTLKVDKDEPKLHEFYGNTGYKGMMTFEVGQQLNAGLMCQRYTCKHSDLISNQHFQSEIGELYQCPCSLDRVGLQWQFFKDEGNTKCFAISPVAKRRLLVNNQRNRLCCYSWTPPKSDSWEDWQESWQAGSFIPTGHILISDPWPSSPSFLAYKDAEENMQANTWCCQKSPYEFCSRFHKIFGDTQCDRNPTFVPASALGDPTVVTFDNRTYLMNGQGEYILVDAPNCQLQGRTERPEFNGTLATGTVFTAFAAKEGNNVSFQVQLDTTNTKMVILINGMDFTNKFYREPTFSWSTESLSVIRRNENNKIIVAVTFPCGVSFKVCVGIKSLQIDLEVDKSLQNKIRGLLGNFNGNPDDDFLLQNGTVLPPNMTERQIYEHFAKSYLVNTSTSVFKYDNGQSTTDFQDPEYVPTFLDETNQNKLNAAKTFCGNKTSCLVDYFATGNADFAESTKIELEKIDLMRKRLYNSLPRFKPSPNLDNQSHWLVHEGRSNILRIEATDEDGDAVTCELVKRTNGVTIDQNGTITYSPDPHKPFSLQVRAKDSKGAYSPILAIVIAVCPLCENNGNCNVNSIAAEFEGGYYQILACDCKPAYTGEACKAESNACDQHPCAVGQECTDLTAAEQGNSPVGYKCGECPAGTINVNGSCEGKNECTNSKVCDQICINTYRSYKCDCRPGFRLDPNDKRTCIDINECIEGTASCKQECRNTVGSYICACKNGYTLNSDSKTCTIVSADSACQRCEQICTVSNGETSCDCNLGYRIDQDNPTRCSDIDECINSPCSQKCTNTRGGFECSCYSGYKLDRDNVTCSECKNPRFGENCASICDCRGHGTCDRVWGCVCDKHWSGINCDKDVNECANSQTCADGLVCNNEPGSYRCACREGYSLDNEVCSDIDECLESTHRCDLKMEDCYNNVGSYSCRCKEGFTQNKATGVCEDINECELHTDGCEHICINGYGSYRCECHRGYRLAGDRHSCQKFKEVCNLNCVHGCSIDDSGTSSCFCYRGYRQDGENKCTDINECASSEENGCDHKERCKNTEGSYNCSCDPGYRLENDGKSCIACSSGTWGVQCNNSCACGKEAISCNSLAGCVCKPGCTGRYCTEVIDRCVSGEVTCQPNEECVISGCSSVCQCRKGFVWSNDQCQDENECEIVGRHNCDQVCTNTEGGFECSCHSGYKYNSSSNSCQDENECLDEKLNNCDQVCTKTKEGFTCSCFSGYHFNTSTKTCQDVNECEQANPCSNKRKCRNLNGSFECLCFNGLPTGTNDTCKDCNRTLTDRTGYLMSSNYPESYTSNLYCSWTITVKEPEAIITLSFIEYDVEGLPNDYVRVYNGASTRAPLFAFIGDKNWHKPLTSKGNSMHLVFTSDYSRNKKGFLAFYTSSLICKRKTCSHSCSVISSNPWIEKCQCPEWMTLKETDNSKCVDINACNSTLTEHTGYIVSSNYPEKYPANINCYWKIQGSQNSIVKLSFADFTLETSFRCSYDSLTVYDGTSESATKIGSFCGKALPPNITSSGNTLYIKFRTDSNFQYNGFKGTYTIQSK